MPVALLQNKTSDLSYHLDCLHNSPVADSMEIACQIGAAKESLTGLSITFQKVAGNVHHQQKQYLGSTSVHVSVLAVV